MIGASEAKFRIPKFPTIAESVTDDLAGNVFATGTQKSKTARRDAMQSNAGKGFSVGANQQMQAGLAEAAGQSQAASDAAGVRAGDQQFNESQRNAGEMLAEQARIFDKNQMTDLNSTNFERMFAAKQGRSSIAMARQRSAMQLRLALMSKGLA
jgi:hypothetical protein